MARFQSAFACAVALGLLAGASATPASTQYFGRNKVQYQSFDFRVMRTPHFDIYFYPKEEAATRDAARMAERWFARFSQPARPRGRARHSAGWRCTSMAYGAPSTSPPGPP